MPPDDPGVFALYWRLVRIRLESFQFMGLANDGRNFLAGLRSLAQSIAREFGPLGIHVGHVVIDGGIDGEKLNTAVPQLKIERGADGLLNIDAIADAYWHLHTQHRSAWTHELDLRPFKESF